MESTADDTILQLAKDEVDEDAAGEYGDTLFKLSMHDLGCNEKEAQLQRKLGGDGAEFTSSLGNTICGVTATVTGFWSINSFKIQA